MNDNAYVQLFKVLLLSAKYSNLSLEAIVCYCVLMDRNRLSTLNGYCDNDGIICVTYPQESLGEVLRCKRKKVSKVLQELEEYNLISRRHQGMNKADAIYVHPIPMCQDDTSGCASDEHLDVPQKNANNNEITNPDQYKSSADMEEITMVLLSKWNYRYISTLGDEHERWAGVIIDIAVDIMCTRGRDIHIAGDLRNTAYVQAVIMRLTSSHIIDIIHHLIEHNNIVCEVNYVRAMLYNSGVMAPAY